MIIARLHSLHERLYTGTVNTITFLTIIHAPESIILIVLPIHSVTTYKCLRNNVETSVKLDWLLLTLRLDKYVSNTYFVARIR